MHNMFVGQACIIGRKKFELHPDIQLCLFICFQSQFRFDNESNTLMPEWVQKVTPMDRYNINTVRVVVRGEEKHQHAHVSRKNHGQMVVTANCRKVCRLYHPSVKRMSEVLLGPLIPLPEEILDPPSFFLILEYSLHNNFRIRTLLALQIESRHALSIHLYIWNTHTLRSC